MIKIVEANISCCQDGKIPYDIQTRVIEVNNWDEYVDEIKNQRQVFRTSINEDYTGVSFPKGAIVKRFEANDQMLICSFNLYNGRHMLKTAYICE